MSRGSDPAFGRFQDGFCTCIFVEEFSFAAKGSEEGKLQGVAPCPQMGQVQLCGRECLLKKQGNRALVSQINQTLVMFFLVPVSHPYFPPSETASCKGVEEEGYKWPAAAPPPSAGSRGTPLTDRA